MKAESYSVLVDAKGRDKDPQGKASHVNVMTLKTSSSHRPDHYSTFMPGFWAGGCSDMGARTWGRTLGALRLDAEQQFFQQEGGQQLQPNVDDAEGPSQDKDPPKS